MSGGRVSDGHVSGGADTIFALATSPGAAALAVIRVSGPETRAMLTAIAGGVPAPRRASLRRLRDEDGRTLDCGLVLFFPAPASYTAEDVAELHVHGGAAVVRDVAGTLASRGLRPALPGEFTARAVANGRLGLLEAEAVGDLVAAGSRTERELALARMGGAQRERLDGLRRSVMTALARAEAVLDFPEEAGNSGDVRRDTAALDELAATLGMAATKAGRHGRTLRSGVTIAVLGPPNVGKSSLVNALAGWDVSIVDAVAGTTRDVVETAVELDGVRTVLLDTAGLRSSSDEVEREGMRRARMRASDADLILWVTAPDQRSPPDAGMEQERLIEVTNKSDLGLGAGEGELLVSARSGHGLADLVALLGARAAAVAGSDEPASFSHIRHRTALEEAAHHVSSASSLRDELRAEELRRAARALGRLAGEMDADEVLTEVFSSFCIGK